MADAASSVYAFVLPEVGASDDTWGGKLNANWAALDALFVESFTGGGVGNLGVLKNSALSGDRTFSGEIILNNIDDAIMSLNFIASESAVSLRNNTMGVFDTNLRFRFGGLDGGPGALIVSAFDTNFIAIQPITRTIATDNGTIIMPASVRIGDALVTDTGFELIAPGSLTHKIEAGSIHAFHIDGVEAARVNPTGTAAINTTTIMTRDKGDFRYAQLALTTLQTFAGPLRIGGNIYVGANPAGTTLAGAISALSGTNLTLRSGLDAGANFPFRNLSNSLLAQVEVSGTAAPSSFSLITREKGDLRYGVVSSRRFKDNIVASTIDPIATIKQFQTCEWVWGGALPVEDERRGAPGYGNISEDVAAFFPHGVTYQWTQKVDGDDDRVRGRRRVSGMNVSAQLGLILAGLNNIISRVEALEAEGV